MPTPHKFLNYPSFPSFPGAADADLINIAPTVDDFGIGGNTAYWQAQAGGFVADGAGNVTSSSVGSVSAYKGYFVGCPTGNYGFDAAFNGTAGYHYQFYLEQDAAAYALSLHAAANTISLSRVISGGSFTGFSVNQPVPTGPVAVHADVVRSGGQLQISVSINGTPIGTGTDTAPPTPPSQNAIGLVDYGQAAVSLQSLSLSNALPSTLTLSGPTSGNQGAESTAFTVTTNEPAPVGGQVVNLASTGSGDVFHATQGGATVTSITIAEGQTSGTFSLVPGTSGSRNISVTSSGLTVSGNPVAYNAAAVIQPLVSGTLTAGNITSSSISLTIGAASGGISPYTYQFQQAPDASGSAGTYTNLGSAGTSTAATATGLNASTKYWFRAIMTDAASTSATSSGVSTTTLAANVVTPPSVSPASVSLTVGQQQQFTASSFTGTITWTATLGSITQGGLFTATTSGTGTITATSGSQSASASATIAAVVVISTRTVLSVVEGFPRGLTTVGYQVFTSAGVALGTRQAVAERSPGSYAAMVTIPTDACEVRWDTGLSSPVYVGDYFQAASASVAVDYGQVETACTAALEGAQVQLDPAQSLPLQPVVGTVGEALAAARSAIGKEVYDATAKTDVKYAHDGTTILKTLNLTVDGSGVITGKA